MSGKTKISWADATWSPTLGCAKCSPGCLNCYAERMAVRQAAMGTRGYADVVTDSHWNGKTRFIESELDKPLHWRKPRTIFVDSMSDLFHPDVSDKDIIRVYQIMSRCPQHHFMVLTKREKRMFNFLQLAARCKLIGPFDCPPYMCPEKCCKSNMVDMPLANVAHGVTVCNQEETPKLDLLCQIPGKLWVSYEPALGEVDFRPWLPADYWCTCGYSGNHAESICRNCGEAFPPPGPDGDDVPCECGCAFYEDHCPECDLGVYSWSNTRGPDSENAASEKALAMRANRLSLVVASGETGPGARPAHPQWFQDVRDQCVKAGVPFHFKSWGSGWRTRDWMARLDAASAGWDYNERNGGRMLDGQVYDEGIAW